MVVLRPGRFGRPIDAARSSAGGAFALLPGDDVGVRSCDPLLAGMRSPAVEA
jgi:hypothetical protein